MSEHRNEADGIGAADPITGVAAGGDNLGADAQLPDEQAAPDWETVRAESDDVTTNDAVAGETVEPGRGDGNDGPSGGAPAEAEPIEADARFRPDADIPGLRDVDGA